MSDSRNIKFKTLDNKITELVVEKDIAISNLKNKLKEKLGVAPELQRLIYKGKQLKDDKNLSDYITSDDEIIHLMTKMVEQSSSTDNTTNNQNTNAQPNLFGSSSTQPNQNPFGNILGNILNNPNTMMQMSSMIFGGGEGGQMGGNLNLNDLLGSLGQPTQGLNLNNSNVNQNQQSQDINSLLNNLINPNVSGRTNTENTHQQSQQPEQTNLNTQQSSQYPILNVPNQHINNLNRLVDLSTGENSSTLPNVPNLNYPLNVLTAVGSTLENYSRVLTRFVPLLNLLAEMLQRESLVTDSNEREKVRKLIKDVQSGLDEIVKATSPLQPIFNGLDYGNAPGCGHLRLMALGEVSVSVGDISGGNLVRNLNTESNLNVNANQNVPSTQIQSTNIQPETQNPPQINQPQARSNPLQQMISQMSQPGNMQMMMNMVGGLLGGEGQSGGNLNLNNLLNTNQSSGGQINPLGNLFNQLMGNLQQQEEPEENQNVNSYFQNMNSQMRSTTLVREIPNNILTFEPASDLATFTNEILSQFTIQEVIEIKSVNFRAFTRLRKFIREKINQYLTQFHNNKIKLVNHLSDLISERFIVHEDENDRFINQNFTMDSHLLNFFTNVLDILLNETLSDVKFEINLRREFLISFGNLYEDLKSSYSSGKEGAICFLDTNLEDLLGSLIGKEAVDTLMSIDDEFIEEFSDNVINLYPNEKNKMNQDQDEIKNPNEDNLKNAQEIDLDVQRIMELAMLDKNRLVSFNNRDILFSPQYNSTSLYKN